MNAERVNLEILYHTDMIQHNGFVIETEDKCGNANIDALINSPAYTDTEYRCDCGAFIGQDIVGQKCPVCHTEIQLRPLNFEYTGWMDLKEHKVITPIYYNLLKRVLGNNMLHFILGDYKADNVVKYDETDTEFNVNKKKKKTSNLRQNDINWLLDRIPKSKHKYQGLGHDEFYRRFEEVLLDCATVKNSSDLQQLLDEKESVFTSFIPIYSTAFRPMSMTSETKFYSNICKPFSTMASIYCKLQYMVLDIEIIQALNYMQNYWLEATEMLLFNELSSKYGLVRSEIIGGTFAFSGRAVITLDISLATDEVAMPYEEMIIAFQFKITHRLAVKYNMTLEQANMYITTYPEREEVRSIVDDIVAEEQWIVLIREPANNIGSIVLCKIRNYKMNDDTLSLPPNTLGALNGDFDGDQLNWFHLPPEGFELFKAFHYSCYTNYVYETIRDDMKEWCAVSLGLITE